MTENDYTLKNATPAEKMAGEIGSAVKNITTMDTLDQQTKKKIEEQIADLTASTLGSLSSNMDPSKLKENTDILKSLGSKGFGVAKEAMDMLNTVVKETTGMDINTIMQGINGAGNFAEGVMTMDSQKTIESAVKFASSAAAIAAIANGAPGTALAINGVGNLKKTLAQNSNFGKGQQEQQAETIYGLTPEQLRPNTEQQEPELPAILEEGIKDAGKTGVALSSAAINALKSAQR